MVMGVPFRPGDDIGIIASWFVAVIEAERGAELGNALISLSEQSAGGIDELVEVLSQQSVRDLPDFAIGVVELHVVRVITRGRFSARIVSDRLTDVVDGSGVRTWHERSIPRPVDVTIGRFEQLGASTDYWSAGGVVPASCLVVSTQHHGASLPQVVTAMPPPYVGSVQRPSDEPPVETPPQDAVAESPVSSVADPVGLEELVESEAAAAGESVPTSGGAKSDSDDEADDLPDRLSDDPIDLRVEDPSDETLLPTAEVLAAHHAAASGSASSAPAESPIADDPYADLWMTKVRSVEDAAMRADESVGEAGGRAGQKAADPEVALEGAAAGSPIGAPEFGDHDGHTRSVESLAAEVGAVLGSAAGADRAPSGGGVSSSPCVNGHANPPFAVTCRRCLAPVKDVVESVVRADAGVLVLPDGERVDVDRTLVIGRNPKAEGLFSGDPPRLIGLPDQHDISRTHVVIELSGWTATVTDQDSMNGTEVQLPGKPPEQLRPRTPMAIVVGTRIVLAGEVVMKLEGG